MNVGFVGAGRRATSAHYPSVVRLEGVNVAAVAELDESRRMAVVDRFGIPNSFDDYRPMLDAVELDAVYVVMGETLVTPIAIDCMNAGKHVFIEKPPGLNLNQIMIALSVTFKLIMIVTDTYLCAFYVTMRKDGY